MNGKKYKTGIVSYTNVLPFLYGLQKMDEIILIDEYPSKLTGNYKKGVYDITLLPVGSMNETDLHKIFSDYCIGSDGKVASVCLYSNSPLDELKEIILDYQSETSVRLVKILVYKFWNLNLDFVPAQEKNYYMNLKDNQGALVIGDRTFGLDGKFKFVVDLSEEWKIYTGLPFVFAAWVYKEKLPVGFVDTFNKMLSLGVKNIEETISYFTMINRNLPEKSFLNDYLKNKISYTLDDKKTESINLFLKLVREFGL